MKTKIIDNSHSCMVMLRDMGGRVVKVIYF